MFCRPTEQRPEDPQETLFSLTYGVEAVIPVEVSLCSARVFGFTLAKKEQLMVKQLDSLEECREFVIIQLADYQQKVAWRYNKDVKKMEFSAGDLVLWKVVRNVWDVDSGKLASNWEGLYKVTAIAEAGAYYLEEMEERPLP
ncbi:uncharacterized protein LOC142639900 [Castanea sativa]|uniref:uncharacterized protein LOC142639900 n=1 Tax=Castanea sativa TaxID=21020 RepID=UPI003F6494D7